MSKIAVRSKKRRAKRNPSSGPKSNPPLFTDLMQSVLPGLGGFAATRFGTRVAMAQVAKRWPKASKHAGAAVSLGMFLAAWFAGHKVKMLAKYHAQITVGAAIGAGVNLVQIYLPKIGWLFGDPTQPALGASNPVLARRSALPDDLEEFTDDPKLYTYNSEYDAPAPSDDDGTTAAPPQSPDPLDALLDDDELASGVFSGGFGSTPN